MNADGPDNSATNEKLSAIAAEVACLKKAVATIQQTESSGIQTAALGH